MKRRLFNLAAAVSLVLCLAAVALWVRGYFVHDWLCYEYSSRVTAHRVAWVAASARGTVLLGREHAAGTPKGLVLRSAPVSRRNGVGEFVRAYGWLRMGFGYGRQPDTFGVCVPHWALLVAFAAAPAYRILRALRELNPPGTCAHCGYDLRATPGRCPECGAVPRAAQPPHNPPMQRTGGSGIL